MAVAAADPEATRAVHADVARVRRRAGPRRAAGHVLAGGRRAAGQPAQHARGARRRRRRAARRSQLPGLIVQLSDPHLASAGERARPRRWPPRWRACGRSRERPDAVLVSGDIADSGVGRRVRARARAAGAAGRARAPDRRQPRPLRASAPTTPCAAASCGWWPATPRVPGRDDGTLDVEWLEARLAENPQAPTIVAMHHPPVPIGIAWLDGIGLPAEQRAALAELLARSPQVAPGGGRPRAPRDGHGEPRRRAGRSPARAPTCRPRSSFADRAPWRSPTSRRRSSSTRSSTASWSATYSRSRCASGSSPTTSPAPPTAPRRSPPAGYRTVVALSADAVIEADVVAIDTDSREAPAPDPRGRGVPGAAGGDAGEEDRLDPARACGGGDRRRAGGDGRRGGRRPGVPGDGAGDPRRAADRRRARRVRRRANAAAARCATRRRRRTLPRSCASDSAGASSGSARPAWPTRSRRACRPRRLPRSPRARRFWWSPARRRPSPATSCGSSKKREWRSPATARAPARPSRAARTLW